MELKKYILIVLVFITFILQSCVELLPNKCDCELSGQEVFIDYKGEYYWIETYPEANTWGPYSDPAHAYSAIERCEELEKSCD